MKTRESCVLTFSTDSGRTRSVRIPSPRPVLSQGAVFSAAGSIISANPFDGSVGSLTGLARAERISETRLVLI